MTSFGEEFCKISFLVKANLAGDCQEIGTLDEYCEFNFVGIIFVEVSLVGIPRIPKKMFITFFKHTFVNN